MPRSEAKIAADKKYREKLKRWGADLYIEEAEAVDEIRKKHGLTCRNFILGAAYQLQHERETIPRIKKKYDKCETFKEVRALSGLTQARFSEIFKIPRRTIQDWEAGTNKIAPYLLDMIKYVLVHEGIISTKKTEE